MSRLEYEKRINRVIDHIRDHLAEDLTLQELARVAAFSSFHFHRVFHAVTGETLFAFIQRLRLERAALALLHHRDQSVLAIALDSGFSSAATFARAFKLRVGMSATAWRGGGAERRSKQSKANRKPRKASAPPARCRYDACVVVPRTFAGDRLVNLTDVPGGKYAVTRFAGTAHEIVAAWNAFYRDWLPGSGYEPADRACLEIYRGRPAASDRPGAFRCELCMPVRPL